MHIYFLGIGGTGIGPLAMIARQAGYEVSGSDFYESEYTKSLAKSGISVVIGDPNESEIAQSHAEHPIDWVVSVSAIIRQKPNHPVFEFCRAQDIRLSERDQCLNEILATKNLKMIAAAGTHGKTTTTAMFVWVLQELGIPISYSVGAKMNFAPMGQYQTGSEYFVYECDEFHRNFLNFYPHLSVISGITWDHHEVFPSQEDYNQAFLDFLGQSRTSFLWQSDATRIGAASTQDIIVLNDNHSEIPEIKLYGEYNRRDAWLVVEAVHRLIGVDKKKLIEIISRFPGTSRRMEELAPNLFSDYAHTPEKIIGCLSVAQEIAQERRKQVVVVYEPLTNRRQHFVKEQYRDCFLNVSKLFWVPSYLAREDPAQELLTPESLITNLSNPDVASPAQLDDQLWKNISSLLEDSIVVCMSGGGGNSLDEWLRAKVQEQNR